MGSTGAKTGFVFLIIMLLPSLVFGVTARVKWNKNTESDLAGYWVYYGQSPSKYDHIVGVGLSASIDISGLEAGRTYYFAVTALDTSGNQSGFSQQVSITIPAGTDGGGSDDGDGSDNKGVSDTSNLIDNWVLQIERLIREMFGLTSNDILYKLLSTTGPWSDGIPASSAVSSVTKAHDASSLEEAYPARDAVLKAGMPFDLTSIYPKGSYFFYPLDANCPEINSDMLIAPYPGRYLYMVFDEFGAGFHVLRLTVAEEIYTLMTYDPARGLLLEDLALSMSLDMLPDTTDGVVPIALGWGGDWIFPGSAQIVQGEEAQSFDILPYDLTFKEPVVVSLPYAGRQAYVLWWDEKGGAWVRLEDVQLSNGLLTFSTLAPGRFKVTDQPQASDEGKDDPYKGRDNACFVRSAR